MMSDKNVIDFQKAKVRINDRKVTECIDTNDAVLDISDVVFTADDLDYDTTVTDDYIIISTQPKDTEET